MSHPDFTNLAPALVKKLLKKAEAMATEELGLAGSFAISEGLHLALPYIEALLTPELPVVAKTKVLELNIEKADGEGEG